jgi:hypothetical protein
MIIFSPFFILHFFFQSHLLRSNPAEPVPLALALFSSGHRTASPVHDLLPLYLRGIAALAIALIPAPVSAAFAASFVIAALAGSETLLLRSYDRFRDWVRGLCLLNLYFICQSYE